MHWDNCVWIRHVLDAWQVEWMTLKYWLTKKFTVADCDRNTEMFVSTTLQNVSTITRATIVVQYFINNTNSWLSISGIKRIWLIYNYNNKVLYLCQIQTNVTWVSGCLFFLPQGCIQLIQLFLFCSGCGVCNIAKYCRRIELKLYSDNTNRKRVVCVELAFLLVTSHLLSWSLKCDYHLQVIPPIFTSTKAILLLTLCEIESWLYYYVVHCCNGTLTNWLPVLHTFLRDSFNAKCSGV